MGLPREVALICNYHSSPSLMPSIEQLQARIDRIDERLQSWSTKPQTERRLAKIARQEARREHLYAQIAYIEEREAAAIERAEPLIDPVTGFELPKDNFGFRVEQSDWGVTVLVDIYDSPFDDFFTAGEELYLKAGASGKRTPFGIQSRHSTVLLADGDYWEGQPIQTLVAGQSSWADWPEFSHLALTLGKDRQFSSILASATYETAELFG